MDVIDLKISVMHRQIVSDTSNCDMKKGEYNIEFGHGE